MKAKITHVAVYVKDLEAAKHYYTSFFSGTSNSIYKNSKGFSSYFIRFDSEVSLELMHHESLEERAVVDKANGYSHLAFSVGSEDAVVALTRDIAEAGFTVYSEPRRTGDGYFESCVADPEGNRVEITV